MESVKAVGPQGSLFTVQGWILRAQGHSRDLEPIVVRKVFFKKAPNKKHQFSEIDKRKHSK